MTESGHDLATRLIAKHGTDRYPQIPDQALKVAAEVGELADAILKHRSQHDGCPHDLYHGRPQECPHIRREFADAGFALYALGTKLGLNLMACMAEVLAAETRTFTAVTRPCGGCGDPIDASSDDEYCSAACANGEG